MRISYWSSDVCSSDLDDSTAIEAEKGEVIAVVNGENLYEADLSAFIQQLPPQPPAQVQLLLPQILAQLVNNQLTIPAGRSSGLSGDGEDRRRVGQLGDLLTATSNLPPATTGRVTASPGGPDQPHTTQ